MLDVRSQPQPAQAGVLAPEPPQITITILHNHRAEHDIETRHQTSGRALLRLVGGSWDKDCNLQLYSDRGVNNDLR